MMVLKYLLSYCMMVRRVGFEAFACGRCGEYIVDMGSRPLDQAADKFSIPSYSEFDRVDA